MSSAPHPAYVRIRSRRRHERSGDRSTPPADEELMAGFRFNANDLQRLNRLAFLPRAASADEQEGMRRSPRGGAGTEFLDFRPYASGDDVRKVDWNVYS